MIIIQLFIGIIFALGIGCILFDVFKVPFMKASRATHNLGRKGDKKVSNIKLFLEGFAAELAPKLKLNEWKSTSLKKTFVPQVWARLHRSCLWQEPPRKRCL